VALAGALLGGGCVLSGMMEQKRVAQQMQADAAAAGAQAQKMKHTDMYVTAPEAWLCASAADANQNKSCEGGKRYRHNQTIPVIGTGAEAGVWKSEFWDAKGAHPGFVLASAVNELPDISGIDGFTRDVDTRYPEAKRIPIQVVDYEDMISQPKAYQGRYLVIRQGSRSMTNKDFRDGLFSFTIPIPAASGSGVPALAQFEFKSDIVVKEFEAGERSYECGPSYCDEFVIVAQLTGRTIDRPDRLGNVHRLPVFSVIELGDRYGARKSD
jgi:hypothetical protein